MPQGSGRQEVPAAFRMAVQEVHAVDELIAILICVHTDGPLEEEVDNLHAGPVMIDLHADSPQPTSHASNFSTALVQPSSTGSLSVGPLGRMVRAWPHCGVRRRWRLWPLFVERRGSGGRLVMRLRPTPEALATRLELKNGHPK